MIHWIADPILFRLGPFELRWYAIWFVIGMILSYRTVHRMFMNDNASPDHSDRLFFYVFVGALLGARLGHVLFYEPVSYVGHPLNILKFWEGGLASHGAVLGAIVAGFLYDKKYRLGFLWMADRVSIGIVLIGGFIRIGNLFNSEILGKETDVPWAIIFSRIDSHPRHPAQLYEALFYFGLFFVMRRLYYRTTIKNDRGALFGIFLAAVFTFRFFIEFLKENQVTFESRLPLNMGQFLSLPLIGLGLWCFFKAGPKKLEAHR